MTLLLCAAARLLFLQPLDEPLVSQSYCCWALIRSPLLLVVSLSCADSEAVVPWSLCLAPCLVVPRYRWRQYPSSMVLALVFSLSVTWDKIVVGGLFDERPIDLSDIGGLAARFVVCHFLCCQCGSLSSCVCSVFLRPPLHHSDKSWALYL